MYGSYATGVTTGPHLIVEMISAIAGAKLTHVPFAGGESIITAVPGRRVEATPPHFAGIRTYVVASMGPIALAGHP